MANEKNLKPMSKRSKSEVRELGKKGGKASGEVRRAQKALREYAELLLSLPVSDQRRFNKLSRMGIPVKDIDNKMLMVAGLFNQAAAGNVIAAKELRNLIGEDQPQMDEALYKLDDILSGINEVMEP